jgi:hypothetical protein
LLSGCHYIKEAAPPRNTNLGINDCFGGEAMRCAILETKEERVYLATPV